MPTKTFSFLLFTLLFLSNCTTSDATKPNSINNKEELLKTITKFNLAFKNSDVEQLEAMITDNYQHTNGQYKSISKTDWINYLNKRKKEIKQGDLKVHSYEMQETAIELFHNTAIVTAKIIASSERNGEIQENEYRVTNIWVIENNQWKRAGFHDGKIK